MAATAADNSYRPGVYRSRGGKQFVVKATATQTVFGGVKIQAGGIFQIATGAKFVLPVRTATQSQTMTAAESGMTVFSAAAGNIFTLPAATAAGSGVHYRFVLASGGAATGGVVAMKVQPAAADTIFGGEVAGATDSEVLQLAGATDDVGDHLEVTSDGTNWFVTSKVGTWTRAAAT